jgi:Flp pilus assembly protein TadD
MDLAAVRRSVARTKGVVATYYLRRGDLERAEQLWQEATELDPANSRYHTDLGNLLAQSGRFRAAQRAFKQAIQLAPDRSRAYVGLAKVYLAQNMQLPEAKKLANTAVQLTPEASNYFILARVCNGLGDSDGALAAMERAVKLAPGNAEYQRISAMLKNEK